MASNSSPNGAAAGGSASASSNAASSSVGGDSKATEASVESYARLDTHAVSNQVWMLRVPPKLAQVWQDAPEGTVLGDLVFTKGGTTVSNPNNKKPALQKKTPPSFEIHVPEELAETAKATTQQQQANNNNNNNDLPLTYTLQAMTKRVPVLHPFTRNMDGSVELHGTVTRTANLQMKPQDERYRQLRRNRLLQENVTSSRYVRPVDATELSVRKTHVSAAMQTSSGGAGFGNAVQSFGKRLLEATQGGGTDATNSRKRKYEGQTTQSVVFELFSEQPFWTVKEMRSVCGRPEKELRAVLAEIGEFHRSGEHKGTWELRSEFQKQDGS